MKKVLFALATALTLATFQSCAPSLLEMAETQASLSTENSRSALNSTAPVVLESATLKTYRNASGQRVLKLTGIADLKNLGYNKSLTLHVGAGSVGMADSARTWVDVPGTYRGPDANGYEQWTFESAESVQESSIAIEYSFALKYQVNGQTYWDNNSGKNYHLRWYQGYNISHYDGDHGVLNNGPLVLNRAVGSYTSAGLVDALFYLAVKNIGYNKKVNMVYTTDGWKTTKVALGSYSNFVPFEQTGLNLETWTVTLKDLPVTKMQFALSYQINGITYWDNNLGKNYTWNLSNGDLY